MVPATIIQDEDTVTVSDNSGERIQRLPHRLDLELESNLPRCFAALGGLLSGSSMERDCSLCFVRSDVDASSWSFPASLPAAGDFKYFAAGPEFASCAEAINKELSLALGSAAKELPPFCAGIAPADFGHVGNLLVMYESG